MEQQLPQSGHAHANPDGVGIERTGVGVVALTRLARSLVQVEHDGDTGHEEQEEHHPELLDAALAAIGLPQQTDDAQQERQHVEHVVALVTLAIVVGQQALVAQARIVNQGDARYPVTLGDFAHALAVVLATGEVPHEVAPVHVVELIVDEERHVLEERGLDALLGVYLVAVGVEVCGSLNHLALRTEPLAILTLVFLVVDAREEHVLLGAVLIFGLAAHGHIAVGVGGRGLHLLGIECASLLHHRFQGAGGGILLIHHLAVERATVEQRSLAILLAAQVLGEGIGVVGRVLIEGSERVAANENHGIARKSDEDDQHAQRHAGEDANRDFITEFEQIDAQSQSEHRGNEQAVADEEHAAEHDAQDERDLHERGAAALVQFKEVPRQHSHQHDGIDEHTAVERHSHHVHGKQVEVLRELHKSGLQAVENEHDDGK